MRSYNPDMVDWGDSFDDMEPGDFEFLGGPDEKEIERSYEPVDNDIDYDDGPCFATHREDKYFEPQEKDIPQLNRQIDPL